MPKNIGRNLFKTAIAVLLVFVVLSGVSPAWGQNVPPVKAWIIVPVKGISAGVEGPTITAFDNRTDRWIAEMKKESVEVTLQKSTDAAEYMEFATRINANFGSYIDTDELRDKTFYSRDIETLLSNRRFRKAYEDIQKTDRKKAAELLTKNIRENLAVLRTMHLSDKEMRARGEHNVYPGTYPDVNSYRQSSNPDMPPTRFGRRYALFSYLLLASLFELKEVRPAIEEVIQHAKEEYQFFSSMPSPGLLDRSIYNPSLLMTATLCDPTWNADKKKRLEGKLVKDREVVDWESRALEHDRDAYIGLIPVKPHKEMLTIRYYKSITDAEFNDFFGK